MDLQLEETDTLSGLEERIHRAVALVGALKDENADLKVRLAAAERESHEAIAASAAATQALTELQTSASKTEKELQLLLAERRQVKTRIEKLAEQMDLLGSL